MRKGAAVVVAVGLFFGAVDGAGAVPTITDALLSAPAVVGDEAALSVRAVDPAAPVNGFAFAFANGDRFAGSACRPPDSRGRAPGKPFRPGDVVSATARTVFDAAGVSTARVAVVSGGCGTPTGAVLQPFQVTATNPGEPTKPLLPGLPVPVAVIQSILDLPALGPILGTTAAERCKGASVVPVAGGEGLARRATLCLINRERQRRGLGVVHSDRKLKIAATRHARAMVKGGWFAHMGPDGLDLPARARRVAWPGRGRAWELAENLGAGIGPIATPKAMVRAWLGSTAHRANLLGRRFDRLGLAIVAGTPEDPTEGATYATVFGFVEA